jgi:hypothetical protein
MRHDSVVLGRTPPGLRRKAREAYLPKVGFLLWWSIHTPWCLAELHSPLRIQSDVGVARLLWAGREDSVIQPNQSEIRW